jgi:hypothetical protein
LPPFAARASGERPVAKSNFLGAFPSLDLTDLPPSPRLRRALRMSLFICTLIAGTSLLTRGAIETVALKQPQVADPPYVHPHKIKGRVRFFTDRQEEIYAVAEPLQFPSWVVSFVILVASVRIEESFKKQKQQDLLDRIASEV